MTQPHHHGVCSGESPVGMATSASIDNVLRNLRGCAALPRVLGPELLAALPVSPMKTEPSRIQ